MKKLFTAFVLFALTASFGWAQTSGGPDAFGYVWRNSNDPNGPTFSWIDIDPLPGTVTVSGLADDNIVGPFTMNIPFQYYWYEPAKFWIGSNGYVGFSNTPVAHPFPTIPSPTLINDYLAAMTTDLTFTDAGSQPVPGASCKYWFSPGNDTLIVTWKDVPFWAAPPGTGYSGLNTFQAILSTVDSSITYQYMLQSGTSASTAQFVSTGIENNSGSIGLQVLYDFYPVQGTAVKFYYPDTVTLAIKDASTSWCNNPDNGGLFLSKNGGGYVSMAEVANTGNQLLDTVKAYSRIVNGFNVIQVRDTVAVPNFMPGQTQQITFPDPWTPVITGTFRHITETLLPGDATPSNNQKTLELVSVDTTQASILLSFDDGTDAGLGGLSWNGGSGGAAMHFIPPFAPYTITKVRVFIVANGTPAGMAMMIFDDDGPNGAPMTLLDSIWVAPPAVLVGTWNDVLIPTPVTKTSGGFYVAWMMGGAGIAIGQNQIPPISNRTYEVLGNASNIGNWAAYRYREIEDVMINAFIEKVLSVDEQQGPVASFSVFPNPATDRVQVSFSTASKTHVSYALMNTEGKVVHNADVGYVAGVGSFTIDVRDLQNGIYLCAFKAGNETIHKKITVVR